MKKDFTDVICSREGQLICDTEGSGKRTGGMGDILSGTIASFLARIPANVSKLGACGAACNIVRDASKRAYDAKRWSIGARNVLEELVYAINSRFP